MEDTADIFDSGLFALFAVPPIGFSPSNPADPWVYTPPSDDASSDSDSGSGSGLGSGSDPNAVKLWLPQPPASIFAALQANNLWLSAVYLSDRISRGEIVSGAAPVIELGAGHGLPTIMVARMGHNVVCTDYDDSEVVGTIRRNFEQNIGGNEVGGTGLPADDAAAVVTRETLPVRAASGRWAVRGHTWGTDTAALLDLAGQMGSAGGFDLILADTLWASGGHEALLDSVVALLRPGGTAHVAAGLHTGRGPVNRFMAGAAARGLTVDKQGEVQWQAGGGWGEYLDEAKETEGEVRGVVVYYTLRSK